MTDEFYKGQIVLVTARLTDPANAEALTDDAETLTAYREDNSPGPISSTAHPGLGVYTAQVTADQIGWWEVNDGKGGVYRFYVKPTRP